MLLFNADTLKLRRPRIVYTTADGDPERVVGYAIYWCCVWAILAPCNDELTQKKFFGIRRGGTVGNGQNRRSSKYVRFNLDVCG